MSRYAEKTQVSSAKSRADIEHTLTRYGASGFMYGWNAGAATVAFEMDGRRVMFRLDLPDRDDFALTETGRERTESSAEAAYEQSVRQRWRALALVIKAKLEAVESGITVFEEEFMAHIVLPGGKTVGAHMLPQIDEAYKTGKLPKLLPGPGE